MADDDGRCGMAVAVVLRAGRQNNQDFSAKITKICAKITKNMNGVILVFCSVYRPGAGGRGASWQLSGVLKK